MAELTTQERLQPSLLDRLTDDDRWSGVESRDKRMMSMKQLRAAVLRDLEWLLNSRASQSAEDLSEFPLSGRSVLNYGLPDLTGRSTAGLDAAELERMIRGAIEAFEPRITAGTLRVAAESAGEGRGVATLVFEISGELCPLPMPEALYVKTELDLETGQYEVREERR